MPASKEDILQDKIFNSQVEKYVNTEDCKVAVLNAFPIFCLTISNNILREGYHTRTFY